LTQTEFPTGWLNTEQYHPEKNLSKARKSSVEPDYLNVAQRLVWFQRDQRQMIASGAAKGSFEITCKPLEINIEAGYAIFQTRIRDCLGNIAEDVGSETKADFADFVEKAATKSKGRALASLGYGTAFAPELDEGERVVDAPVERKKTPGEECAALAHELKLDEKAYRIIVQSYTSGGKVAWANVKSALETKIAEQTLHNGHMEALHGALAAHPAD
jgi:hypothetical protein